MKFQPLTESKFNLRELQKNDMYIVKLNVKFMVSSHFIQHILIPNIQPVLFFSYARTLVFLRSDKLYMYQTSKLILYKFNSEFTTLKELCIL